MKSKLTIHYLLSFISACFVIFFINIGFMFINAYILKINDSLLNYYPNELMNEIYESVDLSIDNNLTINKEGINLLEKNNVGLQVLDEKNMQIFGYNTPEEVPIKYSNKTLIDMHNSEKTTLFLDEKVENNKMYSYLLFFNPNKVKRVSFSYDLGEIAKTHNFPLLITINILVILGISFLYSLKITKPINNIIEKIFDLSKGVYKNNKKNKGIYSDVENGLNDLSNQLHSNKEDRERLDKIREEWISNISHDIKTPLTSIIGNAEIISDTKYDLDNQARTKSCNTIINKSIYIKNLVEELNLSTRLNNNALVLNKKQVNIVFLLRHIIIDIINDEKYEATNIKFTYSCEEILLDLDENLIKRVFVNLIMNSFIHNDSNVNIHINIKQSLHKNVTITISDNGKGVASSELNYIFKRYYRGTSTKNKIEGSGLGMAIAHDVIKAHKAEIEAKSKLSQGMTVKIFFNER